MGILCVIFFVGLNAAYSQAGFDRGVFYKVMKTGDTAAIDNELIVVKSAPIPEKEAYEGALLMKKAGEEVKAKDKLAFFKRGRIKLETAILNDGENAEYRFLRLIIEEHAPKVAKYSKDIPTDKEFIIQKYKSLSPLVQQEILNYSQTSKVLHPEDLNQH